MVQRWLRGLSRWRSKPPSSKEVARSFAWAERALGATPAHARGRPEFQAVLRRGGDGQLHYESITLEGFTPWEELVIYPQRAKGSSFTGAGIEEVEAEMC